MGMGQYIEFRCSVSMSMYRILYWQTKLANFIVRLTSALNLLSKFSIYRNIDLVAYAWRDSLSLWTKIPLL